MMGSADDALLAAALAYAERGWKVLPLHTVRNGRCTCLNENCKSPGKHPRTEHGLKDATDDPEQIKRWWAKWPHANIGIRTGPESGIWALDVDAKGGGHDALAALEQEHGDLGDPIEQITGGGGKHLIYRYPDDRDVASRTNVAPGIDVRGKDGYIVAAPSVHASGKSYELSFDAEGAEPTDAPVWLLDLVVGRNSPCDAEDHQQARCAARPEDLRRLRSALSFIAADDRSDWVKIGAALRHSLGDAGFPIWVEWSRLSEKYNPDDQRRTWASFRDHRNPVSVATIFHMAKERGWEDLSDGSGSGTSVTPVPGECGTCQRL